MSKTLREIFLAHGCDKASHHYDEVYELLPPPARLLEIGVYKGASLRAWREWWPEAMLIGIDDGTRGHVEPKVDIWGRELVIIGDSRTWQPASFGVSFAELLKESLNLIIDDGSHKPRDQAATFSNLWPLLAPGGVYVIEDVVLFDRLLPEWFLARTSDFNLNAHLELMTAIAKSGGTLLPHDFRAQSGKPDSVLLEIRKP